MVRRSEESTTQPGPDVEVSERLGLTPPEPVTIIHGGNSTPPLFERRLLPTCTSNFFFVHESVAGRVLLTGRDCVIVSRLRARPAKERAAQIGHLSLCWHMRRK